MSRRFVIAFISPANFSKFSKNREPLEKMRSLFGGSISPQGTKPDGTVRDVYQWHISGARARGFLQSIYGLLSKRRQEQIRRVLNVG